LTATTLHPGQYQTILHAEPPRSQCNEHGVKVVKPPWAEPPSPKWEAARLCRGRR